MYGMYNPYGNPIDRIDNQIKELENLRKNYQNMPQQQPIQNIINTNGSQMEFEARILNENESPNEILVQRKTMFFEPKKGKLYIKELNGDIKEYDVVLPKTEEQLKIEELERRLSVYEQSTNVVTNNEEQKSTSNDTKPSKK
nr:MAG TPA: hypothetical protein [Bacteriophage sp.]